MRVALTHLTSGGLPPGTPNPWRDAPAPPAALLALLGGSTVAAHTDACACAGLLAASSPEHAVRLVDDGVLELPLPLIPTLPPADGRAS